MNMLVSHNEIVMLGRKLFEALKLMPGDVEDAADMLAWNELHGLPALAIVHRDLKRFVDPYQYPLVVIKQQPLLLEFAGNSQSCLLIGTLAADACYQQAMREGITSMTLRGCCHQSLLIHYLTKIAQRGVHLRATWNQLGTLTCMAAVIAPNAPFPTLYHHHFDNDPNAASLKMEYDWLNITISPAQSLQMPPDQIEYDNVVDPAEFAHHFVQHRDNGIKVNPGIWADLMVISKRILVVASAESRRGAGE